MASINQAHLIHDHSTGRSSTRLHAPPGGGNAMGTSFGWGDDTAPAPIKKRDPNASSLGEPAPSARPPRKGEFVDSRIGSGVENKATNMQPSKGFGDTGASSVRVHHAPGGKSSGNILSWS
mmetsp:Transcript_31105/g.70015  ORF Transcript_31105/g.70015 Transcript_31105/m.70015 type:complete len:121 (-) Transcript_31105:135-497(-)